MQHWGTGQKWTVESSWGLWETPYNLTYAPVGFLVWGSFQHQPSCRDRIGFHAKSQRDRLGIESVRGQGTHLGAIIKVQFAVAFSWYVTWEDATVKPPSGQNWSFAAALETARVGGNGLHWAALPILLPPNYYWAYLRPWNPGKRWDMKSPTHRLP